MAGDAFAMCALKRACRAFHGFGQGNAFRLQFSDQDAEFAFFFLSVEFRRQRGAPVREVGIEGIGHAEADDDGVRRA